MEKEKSWCKKTILKTIPYIMKKTYCTHINPNPKITTLCDGILLFVGDLAIKIAGMFWKFIVLEWKLKNSLRIKFTIRDKDMLWI